MGRSGSPWTRLDRKLTSERQYPHGLMWYATDTAKRNMNTGGAA